MTTRMRAGVYREPGRIKLAERPLPEPGPGEARVRVTACGLCGSDLHLVHSQAPVIEPGTTMGHEIAGVVDRLGPGADGAAGTPTRHSEHRVAEGDAVVIEPLASCGACGSCQQGRDSICRDFQLYGLHRPGGFADAVVVPAHRLYPAPASLSPALAALAEPFAVAVHGLRLAGFDPAKPPDRMLVLGAGAIGLAVAAVAHAWAFDEVAVTARYEHQARLAARLGADRAIDAAASGDLEGYDADLVVETVGAGANTLESAAAALAPGGTISVLGVFRTSPSLDPMPLLRKEARLQWSNCYARRPGEADFAEAVRLLAAGREAYRDLLTHEVPLDEIERAFEIAGDKRSGAVKVSVVP